MNDALRRSTFENAFDEEGDIEEILHARVDDLVQGSADDNDRRFDNFGAEWNDVGVRVFIAFQRRREMNEKKEDKTGNNVPTMMSMHICRSE